MLEVVFDGMTLISAILLITGFVLIGIELTAPGISLPGILGSICLVVSVFLTADSIVEGAIMTIVILAILGAMLGIVLWLLAKGKVIKPLILTAEQKKEQGYISSVDLEYLLGKKGVALTDLRPSGVGTFDDINLDIISEGQYISKGTKIMIHQVKGSKLIVKEA